MCSSTYNSTDVRHTIFESNISIHTSTRQNYAATFLNECNMKPYHEILCAGGSRSMNIFIPYEHIRLDLLNYLRHPL